MSITLHPNTIALVEDIDTITKLFTILLRKAGFDVVSFPNGEEACEWINGNQPLVVLCDIMLPTMDGVAVLRHIRSLPHGEKLPVIAVTALAMEGDKDKLMREGFSDYIAKPINSTTFVSQIRRHIPQ